MGGRTVEKFLIGTELDFFFRQTLILIERCKWVVGMRNKREVS